MLLYWKVRYLDSHDGNFKDRELWLATESLDSLTKAAVEAVNALRDGGRKREMLRYRSLYQEKKYTAEELNAIHTRRSDFGMFWLDGSYFEDENGKELTGDDMARIMSGNPNAKGFLPGVMVHPHDVALHLAESRHIVIDQIKLSHDLLRVLGLFARDLRELARSAFMKDGPGTLSFGGPHTFLNTAVSDEEIRSFVTIFRRLYMETEEANFSKAVDAFTVAVPDYPITDWVRGTASLYKAELAQTPDFFPLENQAKWKFTRKRLIDVFIYTQYAHQPRSDRARQFAECLANVGGDRELLMYLFLSEMWQCAIHMLNAGDVIAGTFDRYCRLRSINPEFSMSIQDHHAGLGASDKKADIEARVLNEKAEEVAKALWEASGRPDGGHGQFHGLALKQLKSAIGPD